MDVDVLTKASENGANIHGLFLQGASYDRQQGFLVESEPRKLF